VLWAGAGAVLAVGLAWALTSPGGQAKVAGHLSASMGSGADLPLPGQDAPVKTGVTPAKWGCHMPASAGSRLATRHPGRVSPNITALHQQGYDWLFCPPSEGDL
jgi:hypothetical protein